MRLVLEIIGALIVIWGLYEVMKLVGRGLARGDRAIDEESKRTYGGEHKGCSHSHPKEDQRRDRPAQSGQRRDNKKQPPKE